MAKQMTKHMQALFILALLLGVGISPLFDSVLERLETAHQIAGAVERARKAAIV